MEIFSLPFQPPQNCSNALTTNNPFKRDLFFFPRFSWFCWYESEERIQLYLFISTGRKEIRQIYYKPYLIPCVSHMCWWREISVQGTCEKLKEDKGCSGDSDEVVGRVWLQRGSSSREMQITAGKRKDGAATSTLSPFPIKNFIFFSPTCQVKRDDSQQMKLGKTFLPQKFCC